MGFDFLPPTSFSVSSNKGNYHHCDAQLLYRPPLSLPTSSSIKTDRHGEDVI